MAHPLHGEEPLRIETAGDLETLRAQAPAWRELVRASGVEHPFVTPEWVASWWEAFGADKQLQVITVWRGRDCVAVAPLMLRRGWLYGVPVRRCEAIANDHTPRWEVLVAPGAESAYDAIWAHLAAQHDTWDVLLLSQLPAESRTLERWSALAEGDRMLTGRWAAEASPRVPIQGDYESYLAGLPRKHRSNIRNRQKRLAKLGEVVAEVIDDPEHLAAPLADGWRIEAAGWKGAAGTAIACAEEVQQFYERFADRAAAQGWLRLRFLTVGGRRIAFMYTLRYGRADYILKQGYDPAYATYSPSVLLSQIVLEEAFAAGLSGVDFLGNDDDWKLRWNSERRHHYWLFVFPDRPLARLIHLAKFRVLPVLKSWARTTKPLRVAPSDSDQNETP